MCTWSSKVTKSEAYCYFHTCSWLWNWKWQRLLISIFSNCCQCRCYLAVTMQATYLMSAGGSIYVHDDVIVMARESQCIKHVGSYMYNWNRERTTTIAHYQYNTNIAVAICICVAVLINKYQTPINYSIFLLVLNIDTFSMTQSSLSLGFGRPVIL